MYIEISRLEKDIKYINNIKFTFNYLRPTLLRHGRHLAVVSVVTQKGLLLFVPQNICSKNIYYNVLITLLRISVVCSRNESPFE